MAVAGAAGIAQLTSQPPQTVLDQGDRLFPLRCGQGRMGGVGRIEQLYQRGGQLFSSAALGLALQCMPLAVVDREQAMQGLSGVATAFGPLLIGGHWTNPCMERHPGAMQQRPRSPHTPIRWLHQLAALMAEVSAAERLSPGDDSLNARRLRQRMALAQRLLDPLPVPLRSRSWHETALWNGLRWGGVGLLLGIWLHR